MKWPGREGHDPEVGGSGARGPEDRAPEDGDLEQAFAHLRAQDHRRAPRASDVLARAKAEILAAKAEVPVAANAMVPADEALRSPESGDLSPKRRKAWVRWGVPGLSVALAAALATILLVERDSAADVAFDRVLASYVETHASLRSPTDALLRLPGDEILRTVPRINVQRPVSRDSESPS